MTHTTPLAKAMLDAALNDPYKEIKDDQLWEDFITALDFVEKDLNRIIQPTTEINRFMFLFYAEYFKDEGK